MTLHLAPRPRPAPPAARPRCFRLWCPPPVVIPTAEVPRHAAPPVVFPHSQDTANPCGVCYVETTNLDGETNLKARVMMTAKKNVPLCFASSVASRCGHQRTP